MPSLISRTPGPAGAGAGAPAAEPSRPGRDPFFDNAKYLAIVLVAMGHSWEPLPGSGRLVETFYTFVYTFHMPVFIIIAGYFSRGLELRSDRVWKLVTGLAVPYAVFEVGYTLFERLTGSPQFPLSPLTPYWLLWFLPALFLWRLTTPFWETVRWPVAVALVVAAMGAVTSNIGGDLQMQRILQFLPYYVLGLQLRPAHFDFVRRRAVRIASVPLCLVALAAAYWAVPRSTTSWFFRRYGAEQLGSPAWSGAVVTLCLFTCAVVLSACFLAWVPNRRLWMTALGAGTLYGYLLHGFVIKGAVKLGLFELDVVSTPPGRILVSVVAAAVVTFLCSPPVRRVFRFAVEPRLGWARTPKRTA
ncbi:acyltransferase family protein [Streptomyces sp. JH34]|uniref:acyltransferase family protein n=1 Tax=Streptomyces sp. JH34 TaxID=2793633 RepID=UPI0023F8B854|nr:acyltransferase family protein [Streptomyces sp. JH34]MDF6020125.1 acyltransferase family protein [Streptomyces sp. JH34]